MAIKNGRSERVNSKLVTILPATCLGQFARTANACQRLLSALSIGSGSNTGSGSGSGSTVSDIGSWQLHAAHVLSKLKDDKST